MCQQYKLETVRYDQRFVHHATPLVSIEEKGAVFGLPDQ
jgi:hypothetical protein